jgi:hypothetical protein
LKQSSYEQLRHKLDSDMLNASSLPTQAERQGFVNRTFTSLHKARQQKQVSQGDYVKLINRLAAYAGGEFNDYIDTLAGAAQLGMLELAIQGEFSQFTPEASRERRDDVTRITGMQPHKPDTDQEEGTN